MKERPVLFSGEMVRALLDGRKTMTRRIVKPQPNNNPAIHHPIRPYENGRGGWNWVLAATGHGTGDPFSCPYGVPGDRLWVREKTEKRQMLNFLTGDPIDAFGARYAADNAPVLDPAGFDFSWWYSRPVCPAIHMPRWASRITLEITDVRVERLQEIGEQDARAEAAPCIDEASGREVLFPDHSKCGTFALGYRWLWESINGAGSWDANPFVWVIAFKRVTQ